MDDVAENPLLVRESDLKSRLGCKGFSLLTDCNWHIAPGL
jgi:hypothetical protein